MSRRPYPELIETARRALANGFTSKAAQKNAMEWVGVAYEVARREVMDHLLANRAPRDHGPEAEAWRVLYDSFPYSCAHWNAKRAAVYAAQYPAAVAKANECAALRAEIKAAPLQAKQPKPKSAKQLQKEAHSKTCQICGRPIFAEVGVIAHHGYERPGMGWQTESCIGARELPFEVSRDVLGRHIKSMESQLAAMIETRAEYAAESHDFGVGWQGERIGYDSARGRSIYGEHGVRFTRASFDTVTRETPAALKCFHECYEAQHADRAGLYRSQFDYWKARELAEQDRRIESTRDYAKWQQARFDKWPGPTHEWTGTTWKATQ